MPDPAANVAALFAALCDDIRNGNWTLPDVAHAVGGARLLYALTASSAAGTRIVTLE